MMTLFYIILWCNVLLLSAYSFYCFHAYGIIPDLSTSFYFGQKYHKWRGYFFSALLFFIIATVIPVWVSVSASISDTGYRLRFLPVVVGICLSIVLLSPYYHRKRWILYLHYSAAIVAAIISLFWAVTVSRRSAWIIVVLLVLFSSLATFTRTWRRAFVFWLEMLAFFSVYFILLYDMYFPEL